MKKWTIKELNEIDDIDFIKIILQTKANTLHPYSPLNQKLNKVIETLDSFREVIIEDTPEIKYVLTNYNEILINEKFITINNKIFNEELFEYSIIYREDLLEDLMLWIGENSKSKELMKQDLVMLMKVPDDYIFSSISTNEYIYQGHSDFDKTCEELIELNKTIS